MSEAPGLPVVSRTPVEEPAPVLDRAELEVFVRSFLDRRDVFLNAARAYGSPLYVLDEPVLRERARRFLAAFRAELPDVRVTYAVKSNNLPALAGILLDEGLGLDVSSGLELRMALDLAATDIVFSGPAKQDHELDLAVAHADVVMVLIDSFAELDRLEAAAARAGVTVRAGVRLTTEEHGLWRKFGIPLGELSSFAAAVRARSHINWCGLQFHTSWNLGPEAQVAFIRRLGEALAAVPAGMRARLTFVDVGGGFWPGQGEWLQQACPSGGGPAPSSGSAPIHYRRPARPIETFASTLSDALRRHLFPLAPCAVRCEPGRWLCHDAMHILLTVVDRKAADLVITDGGTHAVGWERFETDYFPVINLSRPALDEKPGYILGSLCTPHDVWGYGYFGADIRPGDVLLVPTQGAYTYSLRQHFIKPIPGVVRLGAGGSLTSVKS